jgi:hypothetical protein
MLYTPILCIKIDPSTQHYVNFSTENIIVYPMSVYYLPDETPNDLLLLVHYLAM